MFLRNMSLCNILTTCVMHLQLHDPHGEILQLLFGSWNLSIGVLKNYRESAVPDMGLGWQLLQNVIWTLAAKTDWAMQYTCDLPNLLSCILLVPGTKPGLVSARSCITEQRAIAVQDATSQDIRDLFSQFGTIKPQNGAITVKHNGNNNSFAYVDFVDVASAQACVEAKDVQLNGVTVSFWLISGMKLPNVAVHLSLHVLLHTCPPTQRNM